GVGVAGRFLVAAVQVDLDAGADAVLDVGRVGVDRPRDDVGDRQARLGEAVAVDRQDRRGIDEAHADLRAQRVLGAHRSALLRRDLPAVVGAARTVERATVHHVPRTRADAVVRRDVRVVVVVAHREEVVAQLVGDGAGALALTDARLAPLLVTGL